MGKQKQTEEKSKGQAVKIVQRPYQIECEEAIQNAGPGKHLVVLATGLGKTVVFTHLKGMGRTLILSHRDELVRQPEKYYNGRVTFGVEKAEETAADEEVVSASVLSLCQDARLNRYAPDAFETIIIDEAHHAAATVYRKILNHFTGASRVIGFTATPKRGDDVRLDDVFDDIIFNRDIRWGITNGYLSRIRCEQVYAAYSLAGVEKSNGDYSAAQLETAFFGNDSDQSIIPTAARAYLEKCHDQNRHTLIYCVTKKICSVLCDTITKMLPEEERDTVQVLLGTTSDKKRAQILSDFTSGKVKCIINCMVLTEGTDLPVCDAIINLRPTCRNSLYQQMVGRGTRLYPEKEYCLVLDIVPDDGSAVRRTLCTAPGLFGIDPVRLDKEQRGKLTEETDLLSFCDQLSCIYAERSAKIALLSHDVDLFVEEFEPVLESAKKKDVSVLVKEVHKMLDKREELSDEEFGNLSVDVFADEQKRYRIKPSWDEEIWMSEPDVLNRTLLRFPNVSGYGSKGCGIAAWMPFPKAIDAVRMYCELQPDYLAYSWDKDAQDEWKEEDATGPQRGKIRNEYREQEIRVSDRSKLNKLDASRLIEFSLRYKEAVKMSDLIHLAESPKNTKKVQKAKEKVDVLLEGQKSWGTTTDLDQFALFLCSIKSKYDELLKVRAARKAEIDKMFADGFITVAPDVIPMYNIPVTDRQVSFLSSLQKDTGLLAGHEFADITKRQASVMISFMLAVKNLSSELRKIAEFPDAWEVCTAAEHNTDISFKFSIRKKEDVQK